MGVKTWLHGVTRGMKENIVNFSKWAQRYWLALIILMCVTMMFFLSLVLVSWLAGYWLNALYGFKFELSSCWQGLGAVGTGIGTIGAFGASAWGKYLADSKFNSEQGERPLMPVNERSDKQYEQNSYNR